MSSRTSDQPGVVAGGNLDRAGGAAGGLEADGPRADSISGIAFHAANAAPHLDPLDPISYTDTWDDDSFASVAGTLVAGDPDAGDTLSFSIASGVADTSRAGFDLSRTGTYATLYLNSLTGAYLVVPNDAAIEGLQGDASASDGFDLIVTDGSNASATRTLTLDLTGGYDSPEMTVGVLDSDAHQFTETNAGGLSASGSLTVTDRDAGDPLTPYVFVYKSGATDGLAPDDDALLAMLSVPFEPFFGSPGDTANLPWAFNSGSEAFDYLDDGESLVLTYEIDVFDEIGNIGLGFVTITITGTNDGPAISLVTTDTASAALSETNAGLSASGTLTTVDPDFSDSVSVSVLSLTKSGTTVGIVPSDAALKAMLTVPASLAADPGASHNLAWTFNSGGQAFDYLGGGESLVLTYIVRAIDDSGAVVDRNVVITINGTEDVPRILSAPATTAFTETAFQLGSQTLHSVSSTITFIDDRRDTDTVTVTPQGTGYVGTFSTSFDPVLQKIDIAFSVADGALDFLAAAQTQTQAYDVVIADNHGGSVTSTVTITLTGTNDSPVFSIVTTDSAGATLAETNAGLTANGTVTMVDPDITDSATAFINPPVKSGTTLGLVSNDAALASMLLRTSAPIPANPGTTNNISWIFNSGSEAFNYLDVGQTLTLTYPMFALDFKGGQGNQNIVFNITGTNDAPVISQNTTDSAQVVLFGNTVGTATLSVVDPDRTDAVTASIVSMVKSGTIVGVPLTDAQLLAGAGVTLGSIAADPGSTHNLNWGVFFGGETFRYLTQGESLTLTYTLRVTDTHGASTDQTVVARIDGIYDLPIISVGAGDSAAATLVESNSGLVTSATLTVVDPDQSDTVTMSVLSLVKSGTTTGLIPSDAQLKAMLTVPPGSLAADPGSAHNLTWTFNSAGQAFDYLAAGESLVLTYTLRATDVTAGGGLKADQIVVVTINGTSEPPVIGLVTTDTDSATRAETNAALTATGTLSVTDSDSTAVTASVLSVSASIPPSGVILDNEALKAMLTLTPGSIPVTASSTHNLAWTFNSGGEAFDYLDEGESQVLAYTVRATDDAGSAGDRDIFVTITGTNDAPAISLVTTDSAARTLAANGAGLSGAGTLTVVDPDFSDAITASVVSVAKSGTLSGTLPSDAALLAMLTVPASAAADPGSAHNLSWAFDSGSQAFGYLTAGQSLVLTYGVRATDDSGAASNQPVTITINGPNAAPVLADANLSLPSVNEDAILIGPGILVSSLVDLNPPAGGLDNVTDGSPGAVGSPGTELEFAL